MPRLSADSIQKRINVLMKQKAKLDAKSGKAKAKAVSKVQALMKKLGVSVSDLGKSSGGKRASSGTRAPRAPRGKGTPKYKSSTGETWTGAGRPPAWITAAVKAGKSKEDFLIK